jgi:hypothetical protein
MCLLTMTQSDINALTHRSFQNLEDSFRRLCRQRIEARETQDESDNESYTGSTISRSSRSSDSRDHSSLAQNTTSVVSPIMTFDSVSEQVSKIHAYSAQKMPRICSIDSGISMADSESSNRRATEVETLDDAEEWRKDWGRSPILQASELLF